MANVTLKQGVELMIKDAADRLNITCVAARLSILTKPHNGRAPCHYCGACGKGCDISAFFNSVSPLTFASAYLKNNPGIVVAGQNAGFMPVRASSISCTWKGTSCSSSASRLGCSTSTAAARGCSR